MKSDLISQTAEMKSDFILGGREYGRNCPAVVVAAQNRESGTGNGKLNAGIRSRLGPWTYNR
jgi:hypothetical protein